MSQHMQQFNIDPYVNQWDVSNHVVVHLTSYDWYVTDVPLSWWQEKNIHKMYVPLSSVRAELHDFV